MKNTGSNLRQIAGIVFLALLALLFFLLFRLTIPNASTPGASPPPGGTPTPTLTVTPTATSQPYPPPGGESLPAPTWTASPTPTPTETPAKLSDLPTLKTYPTPGPFREMRILYVGDKQLGFWTANLSGSEKRLWPVWPQDQLCGDLTNMLRASPDGSRILYSIWCEGPGVDLDTVKRNSIWIMNPDGSDKRQLVEASDDWYPTDAIWSPDGRQIAYLAASQHPVSLMPVARELWVMNADGSEPQRVLSEEELLEITMGAPAPFFRWMANGYIYFATKSLYAVNPADGSLYRLMDNIDATDLKYILSPDGWKAWSLPDVPRASLSPAGFQIVDLPAYNSAVWSQDGSRLAYVASDASGTWLRDIASGKDHQLLPYTPGEDVQLAAFSPDNRYLAYQTDAGIHMFDLEQEPLESMLALADPHRDGMGPSLRFLFWIPVP